MSKFKDSVVTEQGKALLFGDDKIIYTKAVLFSQDLSKISVEDMRKMTTLSGNLKETPIGINKRGSGTVNVEAVFSNKDLHDDIDFNAVGWFAKPDGGQEILVSISPTDGTQTLGSMTPGNEATDAIDLVLATAVSDSSKVDVVIDPAGQVTASKLNSIVNNLKMEFNQTIEENTKVQDFPTDVTDLNNLPDGLYRFSNLTSKQIGSLKNIPTTFPYIQLKNNGIIRALTSHDDCKVQLVNSNATIWYRIRFTRWGDWGYFLTGSNLNLINEDINNKTKQLIETINANKADADKKNADLSATVASNKKATDDALATKANTADVNKQISSINSTVSVNKADADSKIASLNTTVVNNKKSADSAIATKANTSDVYNKTAIDNAFKQRDNSINAKADKSTTYTKTEVDNAVKSASDKLTTQISSASGTANNALPKSGGNMDAKSTINWNGGGINDKNGNIGGINWVGGTDWIHLFGDQNANDNLDLVADLGDDNSNHVSFRWNGKEKAGINSNGTFTGNVDWSHVNGKPDVATKSDVNAKADKSSIYSLSQINQQAFETIGTATDMNKFTTYGKYKMTNSGNTNTPPWIADKRGQLIIFNYDNNAKTQIWIPVGSGAVGGDIGWRYWEGNSAPAWNRVSSYAELQNVQNSLQSKIDVTNKNVTNAQNTANSATTKANNAQTTANNALPKAGGTMNSGANIQWNSNIANGSKGTVGKLTWTGATDTASIYGDQDGTDNLDLAFDLGDDGSNHFSFRNKGSEVAAIQPNGHYTGTVDWNKVNGRPGNFTAKTMTSLDVATATPTYEQTTTNGSGNFNRWLIDANVPIQIANYIKSVRTDLQNQINQAKSSGIQVKQFTDENQAKAWSSQGGSQLRIGLITS